MNYKNIIFDFDGVLADSLEVKTQAFYSIYKEFGKNIAEKVVKHHRLNSGVSRFEKFDFYHKTFLDINLEENEINELCDEFSNLVIKGVINALEVPGATWFLKKYNNFCNYWIASATPMEEINMIAKKRGIFNYFIKIFGSPETKSSIVKNILHQYKLTKSETIFLGDALSDYEAAKQNNIDFIPRITNNNERIFNKLNHNKFFYDFYKLDKILNK